MRNLLKKGWEKTKLPLLIIVLCAGTWGWTTFAFLFPPMYRESQKVWQDHLERVSPSSVEEKSETEGVDNNNGAMVQRDAVREREDKIFPPGSVEEIIYETFGEENYQVAVAVARAESGLRTDAVGINNNGTTDYSIFQINSCHCKTIGADCEKKLIDPSFNIEFAYQLFQKSGWKPWTTFSSGKYLAYVND